MYGMHSGTSSSKLFTVSLSNKYIELFGFQLKEGRLWNDSVDQWTDYKMIINESAKSLLAIDNIETA